MFFFLDTIHGHHGYVWSACPLVVRAQPFSRSDLLHSFLKEWNLGIYGTYNSSWWWVSCDVNGCRYLSGKDVVARQQLASWPDMDAGKSCSNTSAQTCAWARRTTIKQMASQNEWTNVSRPFCTSLPSLAQTAGVIGCHSPRSGITLPLILPSRRLLSRLCSIDSRNSGGSQLPTWS